MTGKPIYAFVFLLILLAACNSGEENDLSRMGTPLVTRGVAVTTGPTPQAATATPTPEPSSGVILASGEFDLPAAEEIGDPGFHEEFSRTHTLPDNLTMGDDMGLVLALRDTSRPEQTCAENDPRSGCATIDWSDEDENSFENRLTIKLESGTRIFYLSESGNLADEPDAFNADCVYRAVGGSPEIWMAELSEAIEAGSELELTLTMTKFRAPDVTIGYEIRWEADPPTSEGGC